MDMLERYRGALVGLATGDALGTTLEFQPRGSFAPVTDMVGGGPFKLAAGQWTDDTTMALCLADSLIRKRGFDAHDQMERYVRWMDEGYFSSTGACFDIGNTTAAALVRFKQTGNAYAGTTDAQQAGNGSLMRLAPVPLAFATQPVAALQRAGDSSRTTHAARTAVDACYLLAALILGALRGESKDTIMSPYYAPIPYYWNQNPLVTEIDEIAAGIYKHKQPPEIQATGYVVKTLEAALWAFYNSDSFDEGCLLAVNLGDDADTVGAVYGQLAGAYYGLSAINAAWRTRVAMVETILALADSLYALSQTMPPEPAATS